MHISYLADHPEFISVLAPAVFEYWHTVLRDETLDSRISKLQSHLNKEVLPIAWVAHDKGEVFGTAALRLNDLDGSENLSPWLGGVFVLPSHRRRGVASALSIFVEQQAWLRGYETLYLFTPNQQALYGRLGWVESEKLTWQGLKSSIMVKNRNDI